MQRRTFIKDTAFCAVAVSAAGFIRFNGKNFEGDCETTADILGPFYRPDAPVRTGMRIENAPGRLIKLSGQVKQKDCKTPLKNACVELWHCDGMGVYDNESPAFNYRAKTFCDENGNYFFDTILPVPYDVGGGIVRPAHFHMLISANGYQSLITQLYFTGDPYISKDSSSSSPSAKRRILDIKNGKGGEKTVAFNVTMMEKLPADEVVLDRLSGVYTRQDNNYAETFYKKDNLLWIKNSGSINGGYPLQYNGNNSFAHFGISKSNFEFLPQSDGTVKLTFKGITPDDENIGWMATKNK